MKHTYKTASTSHKITKKKVNKQMLKALSLHCSKTTMVTTPQIIISYLFRQ